MDGGRAVPVRMTKGTANAMDGGRAVPVRMTKEIKWCLSPFN